MNIYQKRVERSAFVFIENNDVISSIQITPNLKGFHQSYLIAINNHIEIRKDSQNDIKDGQYLIDTISRKTMTDNKYKLILELEIVVIKKFYSDTYICMNSTGSLYTQVALNLSQVGNCGWYLKETAFGIQFINYQNSKNTDELWYMAICKLRSSISLCKYVGKKDKMYQNTFWTVAKLPSVTLEQIPLKVKRYNYRSLFLSIQEKSLVLCNKMKNDLTTVTFNDIQISIKVISDIKTSMAYLRFFLSSHSFNDSSIKMILQKIKVILLYYGHKTKKTLFRIFQATNHCNKLYWKFCTTFRTKKRIYKKMQLSFLKTNQFLIRSIISSTNLNYFDKLKWLKNGDFLDFIRNVLSISIPPKDKIMMASYFVVHYLKEDDPFNINFEKYQHSKYYELFLSKKLEELSYGAAISIQNSSIQILANIYEKITLLNDKNVCFKNVIEIIRRHSKCTNLFYLESCLLFTSKIRLFRS